MRLLRVALLALVVACTGARPESPAVPEWGVAAAPSLTIGAGEAEPGHELATVTGARVLHGTVVIANTGSHELQRFDSTGKLLGFEGRKGNYAPRNPLEAETLGTAPALVEAGRAQVVLSALRALTAEDLLAGARALGEEPLPADRRSWFNRRR